MSEIILNWLNDQIQLSKRINNFQQDFNNGYLFGELLSKYNQQLNFTEFSNKQLFVQIQLRDDKKSKIKNFQLLFDTFVSLGVTFNSLVANDIINRKIGVAKKILYQLKMHLEKTANNNVYSKIPKLTKPTLSPLKKLKISKDQYDRVDKQHFSKQLNQIHPAQKTINQQKLLKKFSDFHQDQVFNNTMQNQKQKQSKLLQQKKFRDKQRDNLKKTADFRNQWQRSNVQKWGTNMTVRNIQKDKDQMFKTKLKQTMIHNKTMTQLNAIKALDKDINQFQKKFVKKNSKLQQIFPDDSDKSQQQVQVKDQVAELSLKKKDQHAGKLSSKLKLAKTQAGSFSQTLKKKSAPQVTQQQKHQRQKKRRKMIVQQNKRYQLIQISRRQKYILSTIQQTSKQQKQLQYQIWRVMQNKQIIKQNKILQETKQKQKIQIKQINAKFKRDQLLKTLREQHQIEVNDCKKRQQTMLNNHKVKKRKDIYNQCKQMVNKFISITQECFKYQQQQNQEQLSTDLLGHLFKEFIEQAQTSQDKAKLQLDNYIHGLGQWNIKVKRTQQQTITDPTLDNALPQKVVNNYTLGNILRLVYQNKFKANKSSQQQNDSNNQKKDKSQKFILSLIGLQFAGKHLAADSLKQKFGFNIIQVQKLILRKIEQYQQIKDKVSEISQSTKTIVQLAYSGEEIPNNLIIELIKQQIQKNPKSLLVNYPITYNQSLNLVKQLGNIEPIDFVQKTQLQKKVQSFSRLVDPTQAKIIPRPLKQCGLDLALWIDINSKASFDRFLGRRWIQDKVVHINDQISDQVNQIQTGEKASSQILKNHQKIIQKSKLKQFFDEFGIQVIKELKIQQLKQQQNVPQKQQFRQSNAQQQKIQQNQTQDKKQQKNKSNQVIPSTKQVQIQENKIQKSIKIQKFVRKTWQSISGMCSIQQLQNKVLQIVQYALTVKNYKNEQNKQKQLKKQEYKNKQIDLKQKQEQIKQKCVLSSYSLIKQKLKIAIDSVSLDRSFIQNLCSLWDKVQDSTINSLIKIFKAFSEQQKDKNDYISSTKRNYINMLTRQDRKFSLVKDFQMKYNKFYQENTDMISKDYTKDQLHQRVDDLEDQLFDSIEQKKQDLLEQRKNVIESGWLESQFEQFYNCVRIMLQTQLNRYNVSQKIISDFYSKKYAVPQIPYQQSQTQINYDSNLQSFTKEQSFPRLNKLITDTMRIFNKQEQVVDDKNKKGGKAPPAKKDDKKGGKKVEVQQTNKQPTPEQLQMKRAINIQKSIFRYRVNVINEFSIKKMVELLKQSDKLYRQIQSYYLYTYNIENKCISNLSTILRTKIQNQQRIQNQIQVNYVDVVISQLIRNFQKQKPIIQPAHEKQRNDRFTIQNMLEFIKFIKNQSQVNEKISTKRLLHLLNLIKINNNEKQILPLNWKQINSQKIQTFVSLLDSEKKGFIQLWRIFIFIILSNVTYPSSSQLTQYFNQITVFGTMKQIQKNKFIQSKIWFDEQYQIQQNTRVFKRNQLLKQILWDLIKINSNNKQLALIDDFIEKIQLSWYGKQPKDNQTYFNIAFQ